VCVCERGERLCVCACERLCVKVCVCEYVRVCVRERENISVGVGVRERVCV
jgi:hypothetical protein